MFSNITCEFFRDDFVDLFNQVSHLWDEFDQSLWNKNDTVVLTKFGSFANNISNLFGDLGESLVLLLDFFTN